MRYFLCLLIGYFLGTVNPSYIIAKINGFDIRQRGSHNAGASNAVILLGKSVGLVCALFDIAKPCIAIAISRLIFPDFKLNFALTGCACILGQSCHSIWASRAARDWRVWAALSLRSTGEFSL